MGNCKICGKKTEIINDTQFKWMFHRCTFCGFISKDTEFIPSADQCHRIYENHQNSLENKGYIEYLENFIISSVVPFVPTGSSGLDFGSGPFPALSILLRDKFSYKIDIYDLFYSREKVYKGKKYDYITCTEVIEHLENPTPYFKLFAAHLKKGKILSIMTLVHDGKEEKFLDWHYRRDPSHISFFTEKSLKILAKKTGFNLVFSDGYRCYTFKKI